uniref:LPS-assembly protein LptD n=1 Tax=Chelativorans sp. YIM 93263 TaxID=2906648 RepID=UPI00237806CD|nr:LPS-assembly protein LptD [Chelativorans sp. YIM 93263]
MLLTANTVVYDNDRNTITAVGNVQIEYAGNNLVAQQVTYDQATSRVIASGEVEIVEEDGNVIYADRIDVTDDFSEGFVDALRVEAADDTHFAAASAERTGDGRTTFLRGVYTACEPCEENPDKPPQWQIKAQKIIWDGEARTVRFENTRFEFFGLPLAWLPVFEVPDPTVERKSGFLMPRFAGGSERGFGVTVPYYLALSPTYDLTVSVTGYTNQGFLGEAEWRQRFNNGEYNLKIAGISQRDPAAWDSKKVDSTVTERGMIGSTGDFSINRRWSFGWDVLAQSDKNFSNTYDIGGFSSSVHTSQAYLTGLDDRNFFDLRAYHFEVQESMLDSNNNARNRKQPWVLPNLDYTYTADEPVAGGELTFDVNAQNLYREEGMSPTTWYREHTIEGTKVQGLEGKSGRLTAEAEWKRSFTSEGGLVVTPLLHARGDAIYADLSQDAIDEISGFTIDKAETNSDVRSAYYRSMATAGLEARWPILFSTSSSSHVLEPMAQVFARPDEPYHDRLGIPNEDAQSLVFDATSLFQRDKFSGYDRIEGGTRANIGIRYSGSFDNGVTAHGLFGQSYHLAGDNSYASPDLVNVGAYSGLETDRSDYVGMLGFTTPGGFAASVSGRFDEETFEIRRTDVEAGTNFGAVAASVGYTFIQSQPLYGFDDDRREVTAQTSIRFNENWRGFASGTYDLETKTLVKNSFGFAYDDECFSYRLNVSEKRTDDTDDVERSFGFSISLRTLGDFGTDSSGFTSG